MGGAGEGERKCVEGWKEWEKERGEKKDIVSGTEDIKKQSRERDSKIVELILLFTVVKLASLSVQRPILPFLLSPWDG